MLMSSWKLCCSAFYLKRGRYPSNSLPEGPSLKFCFPNFLTSLFQTITFSDFVVLPSPDYSTIKIPKKITKRQQVFFMVFRITWILVSISWTCPNTLNPTLCILEALCLRQYPFYSEYNFLSSMFGKQVLNSCKIQISVINKVAEVFTYTTPMKTLHKN